MSTSRLANWVRRARASALCLGLCLAAVGCAHVPTQRHSSANADVQLADALATLDQARSYGAHNGAVLDDERVIVDSGSARARIEQLALEFPRHAPTLLVNADLAFEAGQTEKAQAYADRVLTLEPGNVFAGIIRARIALKQGNMPLAKRIVDEQLGTWPDSPYLYEVKAGIHFLDGNLMESEAAIASAEALGSDPWRVAYHRGLLAERRGSKSHAAQQFKTCIDLNPGFAAARARLAALDARRLPGGSR